MTLGALDIVTKGTSANLDILRSIAVIVVLTDHFSLTSTSSGFLQSYAPTLGRLGVVLFFLHTSLVLLLSLQRDLKTPGVIKRFYLRRAFRIYPLAISFIFAAYFLHIPQKTWEGAMWMPIGAWQLISNLLLVDNLTRQVPVLSPLWSLPLEVEMYAVLPMLFFVVSRRKSAGLVTGVWISVIATAIAALSLTGHVGILGFAPCFLAGSLAFQMRDARRSLPAWLWPAAVISALIVTAYVNRADDQRQMFAEWILCTFLAVLWSRCLNVTSPLITRPAEWIARYSYGIYLSHVPCLWLSFYVLPLPGLASKILTALLLTLLVSIVAYHVIEDPMIRVGKAIATAATQGRTAWTAA